MKTIFEVKQFKFPYQYKFPGQASDERILYLTRENRLMLVIRQLFVFLAAALIALIGLMLNFFLENTWQQALGSTLMLIFAIIAVLFFIIGWWWVTAVWKKSIAIVSTRRLVKFIYTTPVSRYSLALPLVEIVDTGAYTRGFIQTFLKLGTFVARSSAVSSGVATDDPSRVNKKYFYIENIKRAEDLQHYISKLLSVIRDVDSDLQTFRPFIPRLKGEARANFIAEHFPEFWS